MHLGLIALEISPDQVSVFGSDFWFLLVMKKSERFLTALALGASVLPFSGSISRDVQERNAKSKSYSFGSDKL